jgi:cobalt/nickel transport system permease protein
MHIPDGFVDVPTAVITGVVSLGAVAYSVRTAGRELGERTVPLLGVTAAFVFAAQMLNFPVAGGTSGHFLGAVLAAVLMGPWAACIVLTVVLAVQALVMADGGVTALGANVLNMAVIGGILGYLVFRGLKAILPKNVAGYFLSVIVASWSSVVLASAAASVELAASGTVPLRISLPTMVSVHMIIGIGEALITTTVVGAVLVARPDLVKTFDLPTPRRAPGSSGAFGLSRRGRVWGFAAAALVVALALAVFISPFASSQPDGMERVAIDQGFAAAAAEAPAWRFSLIPDYSFPGISNPALATGLAGGVGTLLLFGVVLLLGRTLGRRTEALAPAMAPDGHPRAPSS